MNLETIIRSGRIAKAVGLSVFLVVVMLWWQFFGDPGPPVQVREVPGVVTEVYDKAYVVRLDTGESVRVLRGVSVEAAARVRLTATRHAKGEESFALTEGGVVTP